MRAGARLGPIRIDPQHPELRAEAALAAGAQRPVPGMLIMGVVGVQHHLGGAESHGREVDVLVVDLGQEDVAIEGRGAGGIPHDQVEREGGQQ